jgi:hypothetical protein
VQSIQRESLNADNQSAFWHDRYTLRLVYAPATAEGPEQPPPTPALGQQQPMQQQGRHPPPQQYDVPAFLMRQRDLILNTGKYLNVMRECGTKPPRTLPLGTRLGALGLGEAGRLLSGPCPCYSPTPAMLLFWLLCWLPRCGLHFHLQPRILSSNTYYMLQLHAVACCSDAPCFGVHLLLVLLAEYEEGSKCVLAIEDAHTTASSAAMELLRRRENLAGGLAVLKRYFLAAQVGAVGWCQTGVDWGKAVPCCGSSCGLFVASCRDGDHGRHLLGAAAGTTTSSVITLLCSAPHHHT